MDEKLNIQVAEKITDTDKTALDAVKMKRELALANARAFVAQSETAELAYNNTILQLAIKYKLIDGDVISENGEIQRKERE